MIEIVPAIDTIEGKCVRLTQGDYGQKKIYNNDPLEVALEFEAHGIKRLHLVDLEGAKAGKVMNAAVLERIVSKTQLVVDFGGGIKSDDDIKRVFNAGAKMVTIGSIAVSNKPLLLNWIEKYGADTIIIGADTKNNKIAIGGWLETTTIDLFDFINDYLKTGVKRYLCTDISKDGMLQGTALDLYIEMRKKLPQAFIMASGGITNISEIKTLNKEGINSVIIGKAIYEDRITLKELKPFLA